MSGQFRLTKSKFQILSIFPLLSIYSSCSLSKFFQISHFFSISNFSLFLQILPFFLILFTSRAVVFFSKMIARRTKILLFFQILTVVCSCDWSWEFDRSWSGLHQKFSKLENFGNCFQLEKELESCDCFNLNCPNFPNFGKAKNFFKGGKNFEKLENSGGAEICRERTNKPYIPKKSSFSPLLIRSGPA